MKRDVIVVGASAGGLEMLRALVAQFPADFPASIFVVWHLSRDYPSQLAQILSRSSSLPVTKALDGEKIQLGHIYVAPPDHHLVIENERVRVTHGPKENHSRPSVDVLFRSAAVAKGPGVIAVVLSGSLNDGASGTYAVKERGGITIVQDPVEATYYDMPINAMKAADVDYVLPVSKMGEILTSLVAQNLEEKEHPAVPPAMEIEVRIALEDHALESGVMKLGTASNYTCPECHGSLLQIKEGKRTRFRCHTGHAFSLDVLLAEVTKSVENTLWSGVRAIEESQMLLIHIAQHLQEANEPEAAKLFLIQAEQAQKRGELVRQIILSSEVISEENVERGEQQEESV